MTTKESYWQVNDRVCFRHNKCMIATVTATRYDDRFDCQYVEIDLFPGEFASQLFEKAT